tara:strand:- start:383 stop:556 length:174 start_codon:yes stop_codon:yes gene_type:complete
LPVIARKIGRQKIVNNVMFRKRKVVANFFIAETPTVKIQTENNTPQKAALLQAMVAP